MRAAHLEYLDDMAPLWSLEINDPGSSTLLLYSQIRDGAKPIAIPADRILALREAVSRERFFDLKETYGEMPVDGPHRKMEIQAGGRHKTVEVFTIQPGMKMSTEERKEVGRALRVWMAIRGCFRAAGALDSRADDERFLATIKPAASR